MNTPNQGHIVQRPAPGSPVLGWAFDVVAGLGRRFGGFRPRRLTHWLARSAFPTFDPSRTNWHRDSEGYRFLLNPYYLIDYHLIAFGQFESPIRRCLARTILPGMVCFDVGANIGVMSITMAPLAAPGGHVYSFEPLPHLVDRLRTNLAANLLSGAVTVEQAALGSEAGTLRIRGADWITRNHGTATVIGQNDLLAAMEVPVFSLDDYVDDRKIGRIDLIKVDIQGAESLFLAGAQRSLSRFRPQLLMEFSPEDLAVGGKTSTDLWDDISALDYHVHLIESNGGTGRRLSRSDVTPSFGAPAVLCSPAFLSD